MNDTSIKINSPESWGWTQYFYTAWMEAAAMQPQAELWLPGRICAREHHAYEVVCPDFTDRLPFAAKESSRSSLTEPGAYSGIRISGRFEYSSSSAADYPVVGDWVLMDTESGTPRIQHILRRNTRLSRGSAGEESSEQILAANIDLVLLVFGLDGGRNFVVRLLERALTAAWNSGAQPLVLLNKADCAEPDYLEECLAQARYTAAQVPVLPLSARSGEGLEALESYLLPGMTIGMLGKSGVGKSALLNALYRRTSVIGDTEQQLAPEGLQRQRDLQGRHTTTSSRLYRLPDSSLLIDGPGIRELQLWSTEEDLGRSFPEIEELAGQCRFNDCTHAGEPGCAVQAALADGGLDQDRFVSWLDLRKEQAWLERRVNQQAQREEKEKWKKIGKYIKQIKKR